MSAISIRDEVAAIQKQWPQIDISILPMFVGNMALTYQMMVAIERLLALAAEHSDGVLRDYFSRHLGEEIGHDVWLARDLATVGVDLKDWPVCASIAEAVGSQYYLVQHVHPAALLGYLVVLECFPISLDAVEHLEAIHGKDLLRTLRHHAVDDIDHGADLLELIDGLPGELMELVSQTAVKTALHLGQALQWLIEHLDGQTGRTQRSQTWPAELPI